MLPTTAAAAPPAAGGNASTSTSAGANATALPARKLPSVLAAYPGTLTQFVVSNVTVELNGSLCGAAPASKQQQQQQQQPKVGRSSGSTNSSSSGSGAPRLVLRGARADGGDASFAGVAALNCTRLVFPVALDGGARAGEFSAKVVAGPSSGGGGGGGGGALAVALPRTITVVRPPVVAFSPRSVDVPADGAAAELRVALSAPAPTKAPVRARVELSDGALQLVGGDRVAWAAGEAGERVLKVRVTSAPRAGPVTARLVDVEGAGAVAPATGPNTGGSAALQVLSPVLSFEPAPAPLARGAGDGRPRIALRVAGASAFPSSWRYRTYFLPGSRPADNGTCGAAGGYARGCVADWAARGALAAAGTVWLAPGQATVPPVQLAVDWRRVPYEAEYMVGLELAPLVNARSAPQNGTLALAVFGAPPGRCPPGAVLRRGGSSGGGSSSGGSGTGVGDGPMYGSSAALQELHFAVAALGGGNISSSGGGSIGNINSSSALDLDPPFKPLTDRYEARLPHTAADGAALVIGSARDGDTILVDATGCASLSSKEFNVTWRRGAPLWRASYPLRAQKRPCWLRVHVFTTEGQQQQDEDADGGGGGGSGGDGAVDWDQDGQQDDGGEADAWADGQQQQQDDGAAAPIPDALQPQAAAAAEERDAQQRPDPPPQAPPGGPGVDGAGVRRVLYRTYTLRFVPLSPPQSPALRAVSFTNGSATLVVCGVPAKLARLFAKPGVRGGGKDGERPAPAPLTAAPGQRPSVVYQLNGRPGGRAAAAAPAIAAPAAAPAATQALFTLTDAAAKTTVLWTQFALSECAPDRYLLAPLPLVLALGPVASLTPELMDARAQGVRVGTSGAPSLALASDGDGGLAPPGVFGGGTTKGLLAAALLGGAGAGTGAGASGVRNAIAVDGDAAAANATSSAAPRRLPGASVELPLITTADDGLSSKTYALVLYANVSAAAALSKMAPAGNASAAAAAGDARAAAARRGGAAGSGSAPEAEEESRLRRAAFGGRPASWPPSPGESGACSVCAPGTYSTRLDAAECQVCPPGRFSGGPFSAGCRLCPRGSFAYYWGADACVRCLPGTYAARRGSLFCDICPDGRATLGEGAAECAAAAAELRAPDYAVLLSFGVVLSGASLGAVSRDTTGINGSSEGIVAVLVRSDAAAALNVTLDAVSIGGVREMARRRLLVNVSAAVPVNVEDAALADTRDLSAGARAGLWGCPPVCLCVPLYACVCACVNTILFLTSPHYQPTTTSTHRRARPAPHRGPQRVHAHDADARRRVGRDRRPDDVDAARAPRRRAGAPRGAVAVALGARAARRRGRLCGAPLAAAAAAARGRRRRRERQRRQRRRRARAVAAARRGLGAGRRRRRHRGAAARRRRRLLRRRRHAAAALVVARARAARLGPLAAPERRRRQRRRRLFRQRRRVCVRGGRRAGRSVWRPAPAFRRAAARRRLCGDAAGQAAAAARRRARALRASRRRAAAALALALALAPPQRRRGRRAGAAGRRRRGGRRRGQLAIVGVARGAAVGRRRQRDRARGALRRGARFRPSCVLCLFSLCVRPIDGLSRRAPRGAGAASFRSQLRRRGNSVPVCHVCVLCGRNRFFQLAGGVVQTCRQNATCVPEPKPPNPHSH